MADAATSGRVRIVVVDDHAVVRRGLISILGSEPTFEVVAEAGDGRAAIDLYRLHRPDVLIVDLAMPHVTGAEVARQVCQEDPDARVLVLTIHDGEDAVTECLAAGARGYVLKRSPGEEIIAAVKSLARGRRAVDAELAETLANRVGNPALSTREKEVLEGIAHGKKNRQIAEELGITERTAKWHVTSILEKLRVADRTMAVVVALRRGLVRD